MKSNKKVKAVILSSDDKNVLIFYKDGSYENYGRHEYEFDIKIERKGKESE